MAEYVRQIPAIGNAAVCSEPKTFYDTSELMKPFDKGVGTNTMVPDSKTGRIPVAQIQAHVSALESSGILKSRPAKPVGNDMETDMNALVTHDAELHNRLQEEYCYYEQRYKYALKDFFKKATSRSQSDNTEARILLRNTKVINLRLNSLLEIMNYLATSRVSVVNIHKEDINSRNMNINEKLDNLRAGYKMLNEDNVIINTQKEMVRFTQEKNNYTSNQIALWAAMNIVALTTIFYVYRN